MKLGMPGLVGAVALLLVGCEAEKVLVATGGSRADGTVKMSYSYHRYEQPIIRIDQGEQIAIKRCASWGYTGAQPFGGETRQCSSGAAFGGCTEWTNTIEFQCTGTPPASR